MPPSHSRSSNSLLLAAPLLLGLVGTGRAQTPMENRVSGSELLAACQNSLACSSHLASATTYYKQERYAEALVEYQAAYSLQPYPLILFNIARLHHKQNRLTEAAVYYQRYLDSADGERAERARQLLAEVSQAPAAQVAVNEPAPVRLTSPPQPVPPAEAALTKSASVETPAHKKPLYKQWWLWTLVSGVVVGTATAVGIAVYARGPDLSGLQTKTLSFGN
jgi:tetratricopeptide (TPR) repeat protein